ncbi:MAG: hypothetical protein GMKNLPBB_01035 [Myxococcota bacterium]|nr:hypothetical protein [Myxococcota bacterium]
MNSSVRLRRLPPALLVLALSGLAAPAPVLAKKAEDSPAMVTFVKGMVELAAGDDAAWKPLAQKVRVAAGALVRTGEKSFAELVFTDGTVLRLGPKSRFKLGAVTINKDARTLDVRLMLGRLWMNVTQSLVKDNKLNVRSKTAVAGVRGTVFAVDLAEDDSTLVRVLEGSVAVNNGPVVEAGAKPEPRGKREEVPFPSEISKKEWMELIAGRLEAVRVTAAGEVSKTTLSDKDLTGEWEDWNRKRDSSLGRKKK